MTEPKRKENQFKEPSLEERVERDKRKQDLERRIGRTQQGDDWLDRLRKIGQPERRVQ